MSLKKKVTISWSGGKDSAFALYKIFLSRDFDIVNLHTVIDEETKRVGLHGVREKLIERQANCIGIPLEKIYLPASGDHGAYTKCMHEFYRQCAVQGIEGVVFGDIFLEDLRNYRLDLLRPSELFGYFPLWKSDSRLLAEDFIKTGFKALLCSADAKLFSAQQLGVIDQNFLEMLPPSTDPCGENGEFHSFVYDGPVFKEPIAIRKGNVIERKYSYQKKDINGELVNVESAFWFQDLDLSVAVS